MKQNTKTIIEEEEYLKIVTNLMVEGDRLIINQETYDREDQEEWVESAGFTTSIPIKDLKEVLEFPDFGISIRDGNK